MTTRFQFDGQVLTAKPGQSIAAALTDAGHRVFRETESGAGRGIFCGMGVCQDCLVTVDGVPNRRACMTQVEADSVVMRQSARPELTAPPVQPLKAERLSPSVLVVGGGAGGLSAAIAAREAGADVVLLDERKVAGGQYYKQPAMRTTASMDAQQSEGRALVQAAWDAGVTILTGTEVWGAFDGPEIMAASDTTVYAITPRALIVATGAYERPAMIPGWTLPGVMTVGAAQTLWRSYGSLPGKRVALFGNGPLTAQVALELAKGGAEITCLGERAVSPFSRLIDAIKMARHDPGLARKGLGMIAALLRRGISIRHDTTPVEIARDGEALRVTYTSGRQSHIVTADAACMNFGFQPQNEILRLLGAEMSYDEAYDQLRPLRSESCETSVPSVFAIGDCCGLGGAPAAVDEGRIAGRKAASDSGPNLAEQSRLDSHRKFQNALWSVYRAAPVRLEDVAPDVMVCRCEEVTRASLDTALNTGVRDIGAVKRATRIGMGRCQGRYCAPALAGYLSRRDGRDPQDFSFFAPRVPIKPLGIGALVAAETLLNDTTSDDSAA